MHSTSRTNYKGPGDSEATEAALGIWVGELGRGYHQIYYRYKIGSRITEVPVVPNRPHDLLTSNT